MNARAGIIFILCILGCLLAQCKRQVVPSSIFYLTWGPALVTNPWHADIVVDSSGNIFVTGEFSGSVDFEPGFGTSRASINDSSTYNHYAYLSSFFGSGDFRWVRTWGGSGQCLTDARAISVDLSGFVYVAGRFSHTVDFDPGPGVESRCATGRWDSYLSKFDPTGSLMWTLSWNAGDSGAEDCATDSSGNVYVAGSFSAVTDLDPGPDVAIHDPGSGIGLYLSKFDSTGTHIWTQSWSGSHDWADDRVFLAVGPDDGAIISGPIRGTHDLDPGPDVDEYSSGQETDIVISKFDAGGTFQWGALWNVEGTEWCRAMVLDSDGAIYVAADISNAEPGESTLGSERKASVCKVDAEGDFLWCLTWPALDWTSVTGLAVDNTQNLFITGAFSGLVDFDPGPGICSVSSGSRQGQDIFLLKTDLEGEFKGIRHWGVRGSWNEPWGIETYNGYVYVTGVSGELYFLSKFNSNNNQ